MRAIAAVTVGLAVAMLAIRAYLWWPHPVIPSSIFRLVRRIGLYGREDLIVAASAGVVFAVLAFFLGYRRWVDRTWFWVASALAVLAGVNATAVFWLTGPITVQWIYYADLLRSYTPQAAMAGVVTLRSVLLLFGAPVLFLAVQAGVSEALRFRASNRLWPSMLLLTVIALLAVRASFYPPPGLRERGTIANPLMEFATSLWMSRLMPSGDLGPGADVSDYQTGIVAARGVDPRRRPRDVIVIVLESVGRRQLYAEKPGVFPAIDALRGTGTSFTAAYATIPSSTRSQFALVTARYPRFSYKPETYSLATWPFVTLPARLKQAGYATAFFQGGELAFQGVDTFLKGRGFDTLADMNTVPCSKLYRESSDRFSSMGHMPTRCLTAAFLRWRQAHTDRPKFAIFWAHDTHFPYTPEGKTSADGPARHRLALIEEDAAIGRIVAAVKAEGKLDDTLFVVVGDHGEAFGQHGSIGHGSSTFEEEVGIPLILSNPQLFAGATDGRLASLVDIGPTILSALALPPEKSWQGRSLVDPSARKRVFFAANQRDPMIGYREGTLKIVSNLRTGTVTAVDLAHDPEELHPRMLEGEAERQARLTAGNWANYQEQLYRTGR